MVHDARLAALLSELPPHRVYRILGNDSYTASFWAQCGNLRAEFTGEPFPDLYDGTVSYHGHTLPFRGAVRQSDACPPLSGIQALQAAAHSGIRRLVLPEDTACLELPLDLRQLQELIIPDGYRVPSGAFVQCAALERVWFMGECHLPAGAFNSARPPMVYCYEKTSPYEYAVGCGLPLVVLRHP